MKDMFYIWFVVLINVLQPTSMLSRSFFKSRAHLLAKNYCSYLANQVYMYTDSSDEESQRINCKAVMKKYFKSEIEIDFDNPSYYRYAQVCAIHAKDFENCLYVLEHVSKYQWSFINIMEFIDKLSAAEKGIFFNEKYLNFNMFYSDWELFKFMDGINLHLCYTDLNNGFNRAALLVYKDGYRSWNRPTLNTENGITPNMVLCNCYEVFGFRKLALMAEIISPDKYKNGSVLMDICSRSGKPHTWKRPQINEILRFASNNGIESLDVIIQIITTGKELAESKWFIASGLIEYEGYQFWDFDLVKESITENDKTNSNLIQVVSTAIDIGFSYSNYFNLHKLIMSKKYRDKICILTSVFNILSDCLKRSPKTFNRVLQEYRMSFLEYIVNIINLGDPDDYDCSIFQNVFSNFTSLFFVKKCDGNISPTNIRQFNRVLTCDSCNLLNVQELYFCLKVVGFVNRVTEERKIMGQPISDDENLLKQGEDMLLNFRIISSRKGLCEATAINKIDEWDIYEHDPTVRLKCVKETDPTKVIDIITNELKIDV